MYQTFMSKIIEGNVKSIASAGYYFSLLYMYVWYGILELTARFVMYIQCKRNEANL